MRRRCATLPSAGSAPSFGSPSGLSALGQRLEETSSGSEREYTRLPFLPSKQHHNDSRPSISEPYCRAHDYSDTNTDYYPFLRAMVVARVVLGKGQTLRRTDQQLTAPSAGFHSVSTALSSLTDSAFLIALSDLRRLWASLEKA